MNDRMRPDTFAYYFEKVQLAGNREIDQQRREDPDVVPICDAEANVKQDSYTKKELDKAIIRLMNNRILGPSRVTS